MLCCVICKWGDDPFALVPAAFVVNGQSVCDKHSHIPGEYPDHALNGIIAQWSRDRDQKAVEAARDGE